MRRFSGRGGSVHSIGEAFQFTNVTLQDCGDGWDWRAPEGMRCWLEGSLSFEVLDEEWTQIGAVEIHHRSGRVGFPRCLSGKSVRASGSCYPTTLLATGESWTLDVEAVVAESTTLGGGDAVLTATRVTGSTACIRGIVDLPIGEVLMLLPVASGAFVAVGRTQQLPDAVAINFNGEGVAYVPR